MTRSDLVERYEASNPPTAGLSCSRGMALAGIGDYDAAIEAFSHATSDRLYGDFARKQILRIKSLRTQSR